MEDVIFGGTGKRAPVGGFAQVTLVLDNTGHLFPFQGHLLSAKKRSWHVSRNILKISTDLVSEEL